MARFEFKLPDIGEGVTEGEVVSWLVAPGDRVREDQEMVEVMTDKATVTIGAPKAGTVTELRGKVGDTIAVGAVLVVFEVEGAGGATAAAGAAVPAAPPPAPVATSPSAAPQPAAGVDVVASAVGDIRDSLPGMGGPMQRPSAPAPEAFTPAPRAARPEQLAAAPAPVDDYFEEKPLAAPATRKLARELDVDLRRVRPTGPAQRVTREDVERHAQRRIVPPGVPHDIAVIAAPEAPVHPAPPSLLPTPPSAPPPAVATTRAQAPLPPPAPISPRAREERVPIRGMRKRIYENMARSKHTAAHFTYVEECDCTELIALRARMKPHAERAGVKLSYLPFIVKAVVAGLRRHPTLNCLVDDAAQEMVLRKHFDIGIAAATDAGLTVPVVRDADQRSLLDLAREIDRLGSAARDGKLRMEDLGGSSFTITSLGKQGGLFATPVVNYPEVAILGVHEMKRKPVVRGDSIVIGEVMLLSLSFDHRIIDGHVGAAFAQEIVGYLQEPDRLLAEM